MNEIKVGDFVKSTDGSQSICLNGKKHHFFPGDISNILFIVVEMKTISLSTKAVGIPCHDVVIEDVATGDRYLHTLWFLKIAQPDREDLEIDHPVWVAEKVQYPAKYRWAKRHFAGWDEKGDMLAWIGGKTSHSFNGKASGTASFNVWYWED